MIVACSRKDDVATLTVLWKGRREIIRLDLAALRDWLVHTFPVPMKSTEGVRAFEMADALIHRIRAAARRIRNHLVERG